ncbi:MAG: arylsulfatase [Spirosomataceae bacterium]
MKLLLKPICWLLLLCCSLGYTPVSLPKPNIILIYLDDLGIGDVSAYQKGKLHTPNFDKLASGGLRCTNAYATSATCTPSRFALLTGIYPWRNPKAKILAGDAPLLIDTSIVTLPKMLKKVGYRTAVVGKWHLGLGNGNLDWNKSILEGPNDLGFDESFIMAATTDRVPTVFIHNRKVQGLQANDPLSVSYQQNFTGEPTALSNPELMTKQKWHHGHNQSVHNGIPRIGYMKGGKSALWHDEDMADVFLNEALKVIDQNDPVRQPFFLYYALHQPHVPRVPHPRFVGKSGMGARGDAILEADWCVGQLLKKLEEKGIVQNTLIIFSSDNGPVLNDGYYDEAVEKVGTHDPFGGLRGGKYSLFEGGTKVPLLVYWKSHIRPSVSNALLCQLDFMASLGSLVKAPVPANDGQNYLLEFMGISTKGRKDLVLEASGKLAYRRGNYVLIPPYKGNAVLKEVNIELGLSSEFQLYDLSKDPAQRTNLAKVKPDLLNKLTIAMQNEVGEWYKPDGSSLEVK